MNSCSLRPLVVLHAPNEMSSCSISATPDPEHFATERNMCVRIERLWDEPKCHLGNKGATGIVYACKHRLPK